MKRITKDRKRLIKTKPFNVKVLIKKALKGFNSVEQFILRQLKVVAMSAKRKIKNAK